MRVVGSYSYVDITGISGVGERKRLPFLAAKLLGSIPTVKGFLE